MVYLPPGAELRGGSWVVIDSTINSAMMEMYSDPTACGGVLEPEAIVEIKFRSKDIRKTMERLDPEILKIQEKLNDTSISLSERANLEEAMKRREEKLACVYHQVAVKFAELHDTPVRMKEKGVIREIVSWKNARRSLYWRLRRKIMETTLTNQITSASGNDTIEMNQLSAMIRRWFTEDNSDNGHLWDTDKHVVNWMETQLGM